MSQNSLTDIQKAMISKICESIAPASGLEDEKFTEEAKALAEFFYGDDSQTQEVINYMQELGYISTEENKDTNGMVLEKPEAQLPASLVSKIYCCEAHCYYESSRDRVLECALTSNIIRISANRVNKVSHKLFPNKQTFYVSEFPYVDKLLEKLVEDNNISSVKIGLPSKLDWNEFYNIQIDGLNGQFECIDFHQTTNA